MTGKRRNSAPTRTSFAARALALVVAIATALIGSLLLIAGASADPGNGNGNGKPSSPPGQGQSDKAPDIVTDHPDKGQGNNQDKTDSPGNSGDHKITICHYTGGAGWITITMDEHALAAHMKHQGNQDDYVTTTGGCSDSRTPKPGCYAVGGVNGMYADVPGGGTWVAATCPTTPPPGDKEGTTTSTTTTPPVAPVPAEVASAPEAAVIAPQAATVTKPKPASVIPPKAAHAGGGSSIPTAPTAAWALLLTGALGALGAGTRLVATKK